MNGLRYIPLINGIEPAWANMTVNIAGAPENAIVKIDYEDSQKMENIYGAGQRPIGRGYGNIESKCGVTLLRSAVEAFRASSPTGRLQDIAPFDIIVCFIPVVGGAIITHKIRNCQFTVDKLGIAQDDIKNETDFELLPSHIEWNNKTII